MFMHSISSCCALTGVSECRVKSRCSGLVLSCVGKWRMPAETFMFPLLRLNADQLSSLDLHDVFWLTVITQLPDSKTARPMHL